MARRIQPSSLTPFRTKMKVETIAVAIEKFLTAILKFITLLKLGALLCPSPNLASFFRTDFSLAYVFASEHKGKGNLVFQSWQSTNALLMPPRKERWYALVRCIPPRIITGYSLHTRFLCVLLPSRTFCNARPRQKSQCNPTYSHHYLFSQSHTSAKLKKSYGHIRYCKISSFVRS